MSEVVAHGSAQQVLDWDKIRRVLLVRLRSIGDTVLMTPCLGALKLAKPNVEVAVLSEPLAAPVLEDNPLVDRLFVTPRSLTARAGLLADLRRTGFDAAFNMHGGTTATLLTALCGARRTVGYRGFRLSWMLTDRAPAPDILLGRPTLHSVEQQLALLHWSGLTRLQTPPQLSLPVSDAAVAQVQSRLAALADREHSIGDSLTLGSAAGAPPSATRIAIGPAPFAVIAPAAALESKRWPAQGFAAAADHLYNHWHLPSVIIAASGQEAVAVAAADAASSRPAVLTGLTLKQVTALISQARVFVCNDSGPMHIAAALKRPIVALFGSSDPAVWHPWTDSVYRIVRITSRHTGPIAQIPPADVIAAIDAVMESSQTATPSDSAQVALRG